MFTKALKEASEEEAREKLKPIPEGKTCTECGCVLTHDNLTQSRLEQYIYICSQCITERLTSLRGSYRYEKEKDAYTIKRSNRVAAPHILSTDLDKFDTNYELLVDAFKETEQFRIDRMLNIMLTKSVEPKHRKAAINYLLKYFDKLTKQQCVSLINAAHRLIARSETPDDIKIRLTEEISTFIGGGKDSKEQNVVSYEKMLQEEGEVELE